MLFHLGRFYGNLAVVLVSQHLFVTILRCLTFEILISIRPLLSRLYDRIGQKIVIAQEHDGYKSISMSLLSIFLLSIVKRKMSFVTSDRYHRLNLLKTVFSSENIV
jgi:hypothetical protein